jgi:glycosyltransferase involved in cell wall biosynthesis
MSELTTSIVVRCKGRLASLEESLLHFVIQDYHYNEVIVVNYDCPNELHQWLLLKCGQFIRYGKIIEVTVPNRPYFEYAHAQNVGLRAALGDWVLFISAEDQIHPRLISHLINRIGNIDGIFATPITQTGSFPRRILFARRSDLIEAGGFLETLEGFGYDYEDMIDRLVLRGLERFNFRVDFLGAVLPHTDQDRYKFLYPPHNLPNKEQGWREVSRLRNRRISEAYIKEHGSVANLNEEFGVGGSIYTPDHFEFRWINEPDSKEKRLKLVPDDSFAFKFDKETGELLNENELIEAGCSNIIITRVKKHMSEKRQGISKTDSIQIKSGSGPQKVDLSKLKPRYVDIIPNSKSISDVLKSEVETEKFINALNAQPEQKQLPEPEQALIIDVDNKKSFGMLDYVRAKTGKIASDELIKQRQLICMGCKEVDPDGELLFRETEGKHYCGKPWKEIIYRSQKKWGCGCELEDKWLYVRAKCPRLKWPGDINEPIRETQTS